MPFTIPPRPRRRGFSGTLTVRMPDAPPARVAVEQVLRRLAVRVETDAVRAVAPGQLWARYEVLFAGRDCRDRVATRLLEEARPYVQAAALS